MNEAIEYIEKMTGEGADFDCALFISSDHYEVKMIDLRKAFVDRVINGYKISWSGFWNEWQVRHLEVGTLDGFKKLGDAIDFVRRG